VGAVAIGHADPLPLLAARFTLASLVAVPAALRHGRWHGVPVARLAVVGVVLQVVQFGGVYGGFALGVPAALAALVMLGLSPLVTTALAVGSGQERGDARLWTGLAAGLAGVAISLTPELGSAEVGAGSRSRSSGCSAWRAAPSCRSGGSGRPTRACRSRCSRSLRRRSSCPRRRRSAVASTCRRDWRCPPAGSRGGSGSGR
jgi:hypothetical protein